jgi:hypothetical protein
LRARDAAERAKREAPTSDWKIKATLHVDNLRTERVRKPYVRTAPRKPSAYRDPRPSHSKRTGRGRPTCACGMWVTWDASGPCWRCRRKAAQRKRPCVGGCGFGITSRNRGDLCYRCRRKAGIRLDRQPQFMRTT